MGGCETPRDDETVPFNDKFEFTAAEFGFKLCVDPWDEDELDEDEEQGAMVVVAELLLGKMGEEEDTLRLVLFDCPPFKCCCSFWAAKLRNTRFIDETCNEEEEKRIIIN